MRGSRVRLRRMINMTDSQFDQIIREKLSSYECEAPDESVWEGIVAKMAAQRRRKVVLRYVYGAVAAAACVALGLFLFDGSDDAEHLQGIRPVDFRKISRFRNLRR